MQVMRRRLTVQLVLLVSLAFAAAACGSDLGDDTATQPTTTAPDPTETTEAAPPSTSAKPEPVETTIVASPRHVLQDTKSLAPESQTTEWQGLIGEDIPVALELSQQGELIAGTITYSSSGEPIRVLGRKYVDDEGFFLQELLPDGTVSGYMTIHVTDGVVANSTWGDATLELELVGIESNRTSFDPTIRPGIYDYAHAPFGEGDEPCCGPRGTMTIDEPSDRAVVVEFENVAGGPGFNLATLPPTAMRLAGNRAIYDRVEDDFIDCEFEAVVFDGFAFVDYLDDRFDCGFGHNATVSGFYILTGSAADVDMYVVTAADGDGAPPIGTECATVAFGYLDYWVFDGGPTCIRVGTHHEWEIANKDFDSVTITLPQGAITLAPDEFRDLGHVGDALAPGWHEFESDPFEVPGIWVVDPEDTVFGTAVLSSGDFGPLTLGLTWSELTLRFGVRPYDPTLDDQISDECNYVKIPGDPYSPWLMMLGSGNDSVVSRIEPGAPFQGTAAGVGIGSTEQEVLDAYSGLVEVEPHKYVQSPASYLTVKTGAEVEQTSSILFETDENRIVTSVRNGQIGPLSWIEGCA